MQMRDYAVCNFQFLNIVFKMLGFIYRSIRGGQRSQQSACSTSGRRLGANTIVAVSVGVVGRFQQRRVHLLGRSRWRIQVDRPRRGGQALGRTQVEAQYELR